MPGICPDSCQDITLLGNPTTDCITSLRQKILSRIAVFPCNTSLPDPITDENIATLFDDGTIRASSRLANVTLGDVTTEDVIVDDCSAARQVVTGREITFEDRVAISYTSGSPATTNDYYDYDVWQDWIDKQTLLNVMLIFCDGDVVIPKDRAGRPLNVTLLGSINYQRPGTQGGVQTEFKRIVMRFPADPLAFYTAKPAFNYIDAGIVI